MGLAAAITVHNHVALNYGGPRLLRADQLKPERGGAAADAPHPAQRPAWAACTAHHHQPPHPSCSLPAPAVISDYVPKGIQVPVRGGVVALSVLTALGLAKLALAGACLAALPWCRCCG